jgi:thymidylate synthase
MNKLDKDYQALLQDILDNGVTKKDRTGTGTISVFGRQIRHKMSEGFPLLTTKKMHWESIVTELLWFLRGDTNIKYLVDNNCHIWDGDAYKNYVKSFFSGLLKENYISGGYDFDDYYAAIIANQNALGWPQDGPISKEEFINKIKTDDEFAKKWGELGPIYGKQWRSWAGNGSPLTKDYEGNISSYLIKPIDQIQNSIDLLKTDPDSRRNRVSAWNVGELDQMVLPPCHTDFQFYTRELSHEERYGIHRKYITEDNLYLVMGYATGENLDKLGVPTRAISLMWNQRSVDTFLGLPFNIASYGLLLEIIAKEVNMIPDELIGNLGDVHLYSNHIEQAKEQIGREFTEEEILEHLQQSGMDALKNEPRMEYISKLPKRTREPFPLPTLKFRPCPITGIDMEYLSIAQFELENYQSHSAIKAPLSN